jgi:hypothetical protein
MTNPSGGRRKALTIADLILSELRSKNISNWIIITAMEQVLAWVYEEMDVSDKMIDYYIDSTCDTIKVKVKLSKSRLDKE